MFFECVVRAEARWESRKETEIDSQGLVDLFSGRYSTIYEQLGLSRESCVRLARVWQFDCHAGRIEIVKFTIQCEVLNVKTEVKSFKSVNQASHDTTPSEFLSVL